MSLLRTHDVAKIFEFNTDNSAIEWGGSASTHRVYFVHASTKAAKTITEHWMAHQSNESARFDIFGNERKMTVVFIPRRLNVCEQIFEQAGVHGLIHCTEYNPHLFYAENDLLSMQLPQVFISSFIDGTQMWLYSVAKTLWHLQCMFGQFQWVHALGDQACTVWHMCYEMVTPKAVHDAPFTRLYIIDRSADYATPLLTCFTYESLLSETFDIDCGKADLTEQVMSRLKEASMPDRSSGRSSTVVQLDQQCSVYASVRNMHVAAVFPLLSARAKELQSLFARTAQLQSVQDMKQFVNSELRAARQQHRALELHISASEVLNERWVHGIQELMQAEHSAISGRDYKDTMQYITECLCTPAPPCRTLALICLLSLVSDGLPPNDYATLKRHFLHAYGFDNMPVWDNLRRIGILTERIAHSSSNTALAKSQRALNKLKLPNQLTLSTSPHAFQTLTKRLALIPPEDSTVKRPTAEPDDLAYVFNHGYTPAIAKLIERHLIQVAKASPQTGEDAFAPGGDYAQWFECATLSERLLQTRMNSSSQPRHLVCIIGGITYAEMAALRLLGNQQRCQFTFLATHITGQRDFLRRCGFRIQ